MKPTASQVKRLWPNATDAVISGLLDTWDEQVQIADLTTARRCKHYLGQISEECQAGTRFVENLRYVSAERIAKVWPTRFNIATAAAYVRRPEALANKVYNGRMGNRAGSNDGWTFRGRGPKMITGRDMYEKYGLVDDPEKAADPKTGFILAAKIWRDKRCNEAADRDSYQDVTRRINGGLINLQNRIEWTNKWETVFNPIMGTNLRLGSEGPKVRTMQQRLKELNYQPGKVDGQFGGETRKAVLDFQARNDLRTTGEVDSRTYDLILSSEAQPRTVSSQRAEATISDLREEGSQTIATADTIKTASVGLGLIGAGNQLGVVETAKGYVEQFSVLKEVLTTAQDLVGWAAGYWPVWIILAALLLWRYGHLIQKLRLRSHQTGQDVSR